MYCGFSVRSNFFPWERPWSSRLQFFLHHPLTCDSIFWLVYLLMSYDSCFMCHSIFFPNFCPFHSCRHHLYEKHGGPKSVELKEIGPRFELRLYQVIWQSQVGWGMESWSICYPLYYLLLEEYVLLGLWPMKHRYMHLTDVDHRFLYFPLFCGEFLEI